MTKLIARVHIDPRCDFHGRDLMELFRYCSLVFEGQIPADALGRMPGLELRIAAAPTPVESVGERVIEDADGNRLEEEEQP